MTPPASVDSMGSWIEENARWAPTRRALSMDGESFSYAQLHAAVMQRCKALVASYGVQPGDRVAFLGFNACETLLLLFACARLKAVFMPLNNRLTVTEHAWILRHAGVSRLVYEPEFDATAMQLADGVSGLQLIGLAADYPACLAAARGVVQPDLGGAEDGVLLLYTSGTTGHPKGVLHRQQALYFNALNAQYIQEMSAADHVLAVLPLFHAGGLNIQVTPALHVGAEVTLMRRFDPGATLEAIATLRPTLLLAVPAVIQALITHPAWQHTDLTSLRLVGTGSSTVPHALLQAWHDRGVPAIQIYGLTESAPVAIGLPIDDAVRRLGSAGKPARYCEARIVKADGTLAAAGEVGEIQLRGPNLLVAYFDAPEQTAAAFAQDWFLTGDLGHTDDAGFYYVDDRKKDMIISGGENIYPAELENVLADMPELEEYAVVGDTDAKWGESPVACVVFKAGATLTEAQLLQRFDGRLARFKHPRHMRVFDALPRNAMGKVKKFELRRLLAES